jgi:hypothetical protein
VPAVHPPPRTVFIVVLGIEPRTLLMLGECSPAILFVAFFTNFARAVLELAILLSQPPKQVL